MRLSKTTDLMQYILKNGENDRRTALVRHSLISLLLGCSSFKFALYFTCSTNALRTRVGEFPIMISAHENLLQFLIVAIPHMPQMKWLKMTLDNGGEFI